MRCKHIFEGRAEARTNTTGHFNFNNTKITTNFLKVIFHMKQVDNPGFM